MRLGFEPPGDIDEGENGDEGGNFGLIGVRDEGKAEGVVSLNNFGLDPVNLGRESFPFEIPEDETLEERDDTDADADADVEDNTVCVWYPRS